MTAGVLLACATLLALASSAAAACRAGDIPCFCRSIGGTYRYGKSPIIDTCRVYYQHQGEQRQQAHFCSSSVFGARVVSHQQSHCSNDEYITRKDNTATRLPSAATRTQHVQNKQLQQVCAVTPTAVLQRATALLAPTG